MSRAYKVKVSESICRHICVNDMVKTKLEMLSILPNDCQLEILVSELLKQGFKKKDDTTYILERDDNITISIDLTDSSVTLSLTHDENVSLNKDIEQDVYNVHDSEEGAKETLAKQVKDTLVKQADSLEEKARKEVTENLERELPSIIKQLDNIVNRVTSESLKRKAATLGEITEIDENPETGSLKIKLRI